jgi:hypothetical protein
MAKKNSYDEVISRILVELDKEQAQYQYLYKKIHGADDPHASHYYKQMSGLCERIRREILNNERK